jgi:hypothetical protein
MRAAGSLEPDNRELAREIRSLEDELRAALQESGLEKGGTPVLTASPAELTRASLSPEEGFILSRVGGGTGLGEILKISPLPELEAMVVFHKLVRSGLVAINFR